MIISYIHSVTQVSKYQDTWSCQHPRKPCDAQVCYLQELLTRCFQPLISLSPLGLFLSSKHILCPPYMRLYIPNLKEISPVVHKICVPWKWPQFLHIFLLLALFYKNNFEPTKDTLLMDPFPSNLAHLWGTLWPILTLILELCKLNVREFWMIIWLKKYLVIPTG